MFYLDRLARRGILARGKIVIPGALLLAVALVAALLAGCDGRAGDARRVATGVAQALTQTAAAPQPTLPAIIAAPSATATPTPTGTATLTSSPTTGATATATGAPKASPTVSRTPAGSATPTVAPAATPIPPPATPQPLPTGATKRSNIGPYLLAHPEAGQPTHNLLKAGHMRAYLAINPDHWAPADALPSMTGYGRNWLPEDEEAAYIERGAEGAQDYYDRFSATYDHARGRIAVWMSTWAFRYDDLSFARQWVDFQREWLRLMHKNGYRAGVGGWKTHLFRPNEIAALAPAIGEGDVVFMAESGAPTLMGSAGVTTFLYRMRYAELRQALGHQPPPLVLDVCVDGQALTDVAAPGGPYTQRGYRDWGLTPEAYLVDVRAYDVATLYDSYVADVLLFATNITKDTASFDVNTPMLAIADSWHVAP